LDQPWYPEKAAIWLNGGTIKAMNPAHVIYECCTNPAWARGAPAAFIDENSFIYAANTLCAEAFGICMVWYRKEDIDQFIQAVLDHIGGVLYTDRETGKITLKLIRDDYDPADLPVFTPSSGLLDIREDDSGSSDTAFNEVIVTGHDPSKDEKIQVRAHNLAAFMSQGSVATMDQEYRGLPTKDLCARVAQRDLRVNAAGLRKFKVVLDRRGFRLHPGAVFRVQAASRGIGDIILRAGEIDDGKVLDGKITISAVQDVFGLPLTAFVTPVENNWTPPSDVAVEAETARLIEATYRHTYRIAGAGEANAVLDGDGYLAALVAKPSTKSFSYDLLSRAEGETEWNVTGEHFFTSSAMLAADIAALDTEFVVENQIDFGFEEADVIGGALLVDEEYMKIMGYDSVTSTFTVERGAVDTWPAAHTAGARAWLADDDPGADNRTYVEGETVEAKVLPRTSADQLEEDEASLLTLDIVGRIARPYPPADVQVDGDSIYELTGEYASPIITWVERNRLTQADVMVGFFDVGITAEAGTTYRALVYDAPDATVPIGTHDAITSGWEYDGTLQATDGADTLTFAYFELIAIRDGIESLTAGRFRVALKGGYGYSYGYNYGGAG
jgi:hypothetical protein